jgi:hypothetical protein
MTVAGSDLGGKRLEIFVGSVRKKEKINSQQSKLAVDTRTFPVLIHDPRKGDKIAQRRKWSAGFISLQLPECSTSQES